MIAPEPYLVTQTWYEMEKNDSEMHVQGQRSYISQTFSCYKSRYGTLFWDCTIVVSTGLALRSSEVYPLVMAFGRVLPKPAVYAHFGVSIGLVSKSKNCDEMYELRSCTLENLDH